MAVQESVAELYRLAQDTTDLEEKVVLGMFDRGLLGFPDGGITLKSGRQSPYYYNDRPNLSFDPELDLSGRMPRTAQREFRANLTLAFATKFDEIEAPFGHVFGKAQAGTAPVAVGAVLAGHSYLWERVDEPKKTYGIKQRLEGDYEPGQAVLLGDDVVTDGKSKAEGAQVLRDVGLEPVAVTIKFDREEGGMQALENYGFEANAVTCLSRAVAFLKGNHRVGSREIESLHEYHAGLRADNQVSNFSYEE